MGITAIVAIVISLLVLCLIIGIGIAIWKKRAKKNQEKSQAMKRIPVSSQSKISTSTDPSVPPHMALEKGPNLKEDAKEMAGRTEKLDEEFKLITDHVRPSRVNCKRGNSIGGLEKNKLHNRYADIGKYSTDNMS